MERSVGRSFECSELQSKVEGKKVVFGCGKFARKGWINLDIIPCKGVDLIHNLDEYPYPFKTSSVGYILAQHVLEHLSDLIKVMNEVHRILQPGGMIEIIVPYYKHRNAFTDPTHKQFFTEYTMDYFIGESNKMKIDWYTDKRYKKIFYKKFNNGFPFWHIRQKTGIWISTPFFVDTLHWVLEVIK